MALCPVSVAGEAAEVFRQDGDWDTDSRSLLEHVEDHFGGLPVDADVSGSLKCLLVGQVGLLGEHAHVVFEGVGVGVNLDVLDLGAVRAAILVEADGARLVVVNELHPAGDAVLLVFEFATPSLLVFIRSGAPAAHDVSHSVKALALRGQLCR